MSINKLSNCISLTPCNNYSGNNSVEKYFVYTEENLLVCPQAIFFFSQLADMNWLGKQKNDDCHPSITAVIASEHPSRLG